jgi:integrase
MPRRPSGQIVEDYRGDVVRYALRFRANGKRRYVALGEVTRQQAEAELANVLADVRRGIWKPPAPAPVFDLPKEEPTFHVFASEWVESRRHSVDERTVDFWTWALSLHLLAFFGPLELSAITAETVDRYRTAKLAEREELLAAIERWRKSDPEKRGRMPARPLGNSSINSTLRVLGQVLDDAVEYGLIPSNPARGRRRRLKASKPKRTWLELDEVSSLLDAAGAHRALIATMILGGLRVGELCALRWRAVDLARGILTVEESKTDAGEGRRIDLTPMLLDELKVHRAARLNATADELVFPTSTGRERDRHNVRARILHPAIERANTARAKAGVPPIGEGITNHTCRRTFASLLYEAGASPAYVMAQMGHASSALALEVYARKMERPRDTGARVDALVRAADWAATGSNGASSAGVLPDEETAGSGIPLQ